MSLKIYYEQILPVQGKELSVLEVDKFIMAMSLAFSSCQYPGPTWHLGEAQIDRLVGMQSCCPQPNHYGELIAAIKRYGMIRVAAVREDK